MTATGKLLIFSTNGTSNHLCLENLLLIGIFTYNTTEHTMKKTFLLFFAALVMMSFTNLRNEKNPFVVIVDAGHGGADPGTQSFGVIEKELTLAIAKELRELGDESEIKIILTRRKDETMTLEDRVDLTKDFRGDLLISLHVNTNSQVSQSGIDCYISESSNKNPESEKFGRILIDHFRTLDGIEVNGLKTANFQLLKKTEIPSVLVELGYLTNANDINFITAKTNQKILASKIYASIKAYKERE